MGKMKLKDLKKNINLPKIDKELADNIAKYKMAIINKNQENTEFMISPYIGVHNIRFTDADMENLFVLADVDQYQLEELIPKLEYLKPNMKTQKNPFNLLCAILIEHAYNSKVNKKLKEDIVINLGFILQFKILTSLYSHWFKYNTDIKIVKSAYEQLSNKTLHKQYGSNYAVLMYRASLLLNNRAHTKRLDRPSIENIGYIIIDMSNSLRSVLKYWYKHLNRVIEEGSEQTNISIVTRDEEGDRISNIEDAHSRYLTNVETKISNIYEWIDKQKINLLLELIPRLSEKKIVTVLEYMHKEYLKDPDHITDLLKDIMSVSIRYLYINKTLYPPYISRSGLVAKYLKNLFSSSSPDKEMRSVKKRLTKISAKALERSHKQTNLGVAIVVAVYVFLLSIDERSN